MRVRVPFGRQKLVGIVMEAAHSSEIAPERLKPVLEVLDSKPVLDAPALALLRWAAEYYHHPIGEVLSTALPKAMRLGADAEAREEVWTATPEGREAHERGEPKRAPKQRELLAYLMEGARSPRVVELHRATSQNDGVSATILDEALPKWRDAARALKERGWASVADVVSANSPVGARPF